MEKSQVLAISEQTAKILAHVSNLGVVQMRGRNYPGVVIQGDTLGSIFFRMMQTVEALKALNADEDTLIEAFGFASRYGLQVGLL